MLFVGQSAAWLALACSSVFCSSYREGLRLHALTVLVVLFLFLSAVQIFLPDFSGQPALIRLHARD